MNLSTTYLGMRLPHPIMAGASPLSDDLDSVKQLEDAGSAAIVLRSLFEEQIDRELVDEMLYQDSTTNASAEAATYFLEGMSGSGPEEYLNHLRRVKQSVAVPVIASLNGTSSGGWLAYGRMIEQEGADAVELNVYHTGTDSAKSGAGIEQETIAMLQELKRSLKIPVAVKLTPFYTSFAHFGMQLDQHGADGLILFNRFYEADIDAQELQLTRTLHLSDSSELLLRLRGLAALAPLFRGSLAATGGVHTAIDIVKSIMAGAHVAQMVSALLMNGAGYLRTVRRDLENWMSENEWPSITGMRGNMGVDKVPNPSAYERGNYVTMLQSWERA